VNEVEWRDDPPTLLVEYVTGDGTGWRVGVLGGRNSRSRRKSSEQRLETNSTRLGTAFKISDPGWTGTDWLREPLLLKGPHTVLLCWIKCSCCLDMTW
jgi:hypothetical protein